MSLAVSSDVEREAAAETALLPLGRPASWATRDVPDLQRSGKPWRGGVAGNSLVSLSRAESAFL